MKHIKMHLIHQIIRLTTIREDTIPTVNIHISQKKKKQDIQIQKSTKKVQANSEKRDDFKEVTTDRVERIMQKFIKMVDVTAGTTTREVDLTTMTGINEADLIAIDLIIKIEITIKQYDQTTFSDK